MNARRFIALDSWRGVCAMLVAVHNFGQPTTAFVYHSSLFVDFFFVLSGFVITHAYMDRLTNARETGAFMVRRFGRLWPLHVTVLVAFVSLALLKFVAVRLLHLPFDTHFGEPGNTLRAAAANLLLVQAFDPPSRLSWNNPSWSISTEFWTYLLFAVVCLVSRNRRPSVLVMGGIALAAGVVMFLLSPGFLENSRDLAFFRCLYGFFAGHLVYRAWKVFPYNRQGSGALEVLALVLVIGFVQFAGFNVLAMAAPLIFGFTVWVFAQEKGHLSAILKTRPFVLVGTYSYSIYMVHWRIADFLHRYGGVPWKSISGKIMVSALLFGYLVAVVALAAVTYRWIEQPGRRIFNRLAAKLLLTRRDQPDAERGTKSLI